MKQIKKGKEFERKLLVWHIEKNYTNRPNEEIHRLMNTILSLGIQIKQGYIKDENKQRRIIKQLNIVLDFAPDTLRLRKMGKDYFITLKSENDDEDEYKISEKEFYKYWHLTKGKRIYKKRLSQAGIEYDMFTDRSLLIIEKEVKSKKEESQPFEGEMGLDITNDKTWSNKNICK